MNIIELAKEADFEIDEGLFPFEATEDKFIGTERVLERFAALVAAQLMSESASIRAETYKPYKVKLPTIMVGRNWHSEEIQRWLDELPPLYVGPVRAEPVKQEPKCNPHPDAPHGFDRNASHSADRYVCECESWEPDEPVKHEPVAVVKESLTVELLTDALTSILKMDVKGYELQERLQFSTSGRQLLEKAKNALSSIEAIDSIEKPIDAKAIRAEALEEAAKFAAKFMEDAEGVSYGIDKAIRGLK